MDVPGSTLRKSFRKRLLKWFSSHQRDLPWRQDRDPYRIWVSEIMLQQTQVATVIPYFERFLRTFPTLADLATAEEREVLAVWEGLGYYRRARDLHRAARRVQSEHSGVVPNDPETFANLPGIGRYMVGAVLSQAYERRLPILEANSQRVLCRVFGRREDPRRGPFRAWLWAAAEKLLPNRQIGAFNQALMELGALVCTSTAPRCDACPVAQLCKARIQGIEREIPPPAHLPAEVAITEVGIVIERAGRVLLVQRPSHGRWANLWEFPHTVVDSSEDLGRRAARFCRSELNIKIDPGRELMTVQHSVTHHRITLICIEACYRSGRFKSESYRHGRWLPLTRLAGYPLSSPQRRLVKYLTHPARQKSMF